MLKSISYCWRLCATALCFSVFGLLGLGSGLMLFPLVRLFPGSAMAHRRRVRAVFRFGMRFFVEFMRGVGVLTYEFQGGDRLGRPGQLILANHPSLIDVVFLIAFTRQPLCIVKSAMWRNPFTRWPVVAAGFVSNTSPFEMVEATAAALAEGQSVIIFPEGTRTTPGQALQFHRGAANIGVKAARIVTPVFIWCDPTTLAKNMPWYRIPPRRVRFTVQVGTDIDMAGFRNAPTPIASRAFNEYLLKVFADELRSGGRPAPRV
jgi:1-acyl-sn-glycerol-3-phosphate acyltransferase